MWLTLYSRKKNLHLFKRLQNEEKNKLKLIYFGIDFFSGLEKPIIPVKYYLYPLTDLLETSN